MADKYRVGSERGLYAHEKEGILEDLNLVIDLENSVYPEKWVETEDKKAYHKTEQTMDEFFEETIRINGALEVQEPVDIVLTSTVNNLWMYFFIY